MSVNEGLACIFSMKHLSEFATFDLCSQNSQDFLKEPLFKSLGLTFR